MSLLVAAVALATPYNVQQPTEVPFTIADDAIIVDAVVNGRPVSLMFDSGFSGAVVLSDTVNIGPPTGEITLHDFVGTLSAKTVDIKSLKFGGQDLTEPDMTAVLQPGRNWTLSYGQHVDGILGLEPFAGTVTEINFEDQVFIFYPDSHDITKFAPDGKSTFLVKMLPKGFNSIALSVMTAEDERLILGLDTGNAFYGATHRDVLERVGLWPEGKDPTFMRQSMIASGPVDSWYVELPDLEIFEVPVESSVWSVIDLPSGDAQHDGTVGFGFLKNFNITFDLKRRRVWLENFTGKAGSAEVADVGLTAFYNSGSERMEIYDVTPGGPADKAGIKVGDELLAIDGEEVGRIGYNRLMALLQGDIGTTVQIATSRHGVLHRYDLVRAELVNKLGVSGSRLERSGT